MDKINKALQDPKITLYTCKNLYSSLSEHVRNMREDFDALEDEAKSMQPDAEYKTSRKRKRRRMDNDGSAPDVGEEMIPREKFRTLTFIPILDKLYSNLTRRAEVYTYLADKFSFLSDLNCDKSKLHESVKSIVSEYPNDIDMDLESQLTQFHIYIKQNYLQPSYTLASLYEIIVKDNIKHAFPDVECILRIFLCFMITNCSGERSFSQLKRIKNEFRSTMSQERLVALSLLCIENKITRAISFKDIINDFACLKSRKKL